MQMIVLVEAILLDIAPVEEIMYPPFASPHLVISSWLGATNRCRNITSVVIVSKTRYEAVL